MEVAATRRVSAYATFAAVALLLGLVFGSPTLVALGAPFAVYLALAYAFATRPRVTVRWQLETDRILEHDDVAATIAVESERSVPELELLIASPAGTTMLDGTQRQIVSLSPHEPRALPLTLRAERWGVYRLGEVAVRVRDRFGLITSDYKHDATATLRVYPRYEHLRALVAPFETDAQAGAYLARAKGDGIEFADVRPFVAGDRMRRINWRRSARSRTLYVNESHPERSSDVVLFIDGFADVTRAQHGTLNATVRVAASLARAYLQQRDRVGIVSFGGVVRWLAPSMGKSQIYAIVDTLLETQVSLSFAWRGIGALPPRSLPPHALVIALTPLLDERSAAALLDLRARGFDLVIVEISPLPFVERATSAVERHAQRLWPLWRETLRYRYEQLGVVIVQWDAATSLAQLLEEARRRRRYAHRIRA